MIDLTPASEEDVTFAIRMSISLDYRGKPRRINAKMTGAEMDALAQKITEQLRRSNMWPHGAQEHLRIRRRITRWLGGAMRVATTAQNRWDQTALESG